MVKKSTTEQIYEDGVLGYAAKKMLGKESSSDNQEKIANDVNDNQELFIDEEKSEDIVEIEEKINQRVQSTNTVRKPAIKISEIGNEFKDIHKTSEDTQVRKNKNREKLVQAIKKTHELKEKKNEVVETEISEIFKVNKQLQQLLSNGLFEEHEDYIKVEDKYITYVGIGSTNLTVNGNLMSIISQNDSIGNFGIHSIYQPVDVLESKKMLEKKKKALHIEIQSMAEKRGAHNVDLEMTNALNEIDGILEGLVSQDFKMYRYYNIIQLVDSDKEKLLDRRGELDVLLQTMSYDMIKFRYLQEPVHNVYGIGGSYNAFLELVIKDRLPNIFTTDLSLSNVVNFITKEDNNVEGIAIGLDIFTDKMICRDFWSGDNFNMCIFGSSGSGKSYGAKLISLREWNIGIRQVIIDPDAEFKALTETIGGDYINIGALSDNTEDDSIQLNPFDFNFPKVLMKKHGVQYVVDHLDEFGPKIDYEFKEFLSRLKSLVSIMLHNEKISNSYYSEISTLIVDFFISEGGLDPRDYTSYFKISKHPLSIKKFYKYLQSQVSKKVDNYEKIETIRKGLFDYADENGTFSKFLGEGENAVDIKSDWTAFNLKNVKNDGLKTVITFIIMSFLEQIFAEKQKQKTRILIDEASTFLSANIEIAGQIAKLYQRARKYNMGITVIAQGINNLFVDFKSEEKEENFGDTILQNTENLIILTQKPNALEIIQKKLQLTPMQFKFLDNLNTQKEHGHVAKGKALIITGLSVDQVQITPESYIHDFINTDPNTKKEQ